MGQPKIVLIGAGSAVFARRLVKDLIDMPALQECHLVLVDIDAERLDLVYELGLRLIRENNSTIRLSKHTDYKETLAQADFVITTVSPAARKPGSTTY